MPAPQARHEAGEAWIAAQTAEVWVCFKQAVVWQTHFGTPFEFMDGFISLPYEGVGRGAGVPGVVSVGHAVEARCRFIGEDLGAPSVSVDCCKDGL